MNRRNFLKSATIVGGSVATSPLLANQLFKHANRVSSPVKNDLPYRLMDLHVHTTDEFTI